MAGIVHRTVPGPIVQIERPSRSSSPGIVKTGAAKVSDIVKTAVEPGSILHVDNSKLRDAVTEQMLPKAPIPHERIPQPLGKKLGRPRKIDAHTKLSRLQIAKPK